MSNGITRETFESMEVDAKLNVLFDYAVETKRRIETLEKRPIVDKCFAALGGMIGGAAAYLGLKIGG